MIETGRATIAAAEAQAARGVRGHAGAGEKFAEAGAALGKRRQRPQPVGKTLDPISRGHAVLKGGDYPKALELCQKIEQRLLPAEAPRLFPKFFPDPSCATEGHQKRASPGVDCPLAPQRTTKRNFATPSKNTPTSFRGPEMAPMRAVVCEYLKNYRAAALFYADAVRLNPDDPNSVSLRQRPHRLPPFSLRRRGRWKRPGSMSGICSTGSRIQSRISPLHCCASERLGNWRDTSRNNSLKIKLRYFEGPVPVCGLARSSNKPTGRYGPSYALGISRPPRSGYNGAAKSGGPAVCDEAIAFRAECSGGVTLRGILTYPEVGALDDFRKAVTLETIATSHAISSPTTP